MADNNEECPAFNEKDIDDWKTLTPKEQDEVKDFYNSICELLKLFSQVGDQTNQTDAKNNTKGKEGKEGKGKKEEGKGKGRKLADNSTNTTN